MEADRLFAQNAELLMISAAAWMKIARRAVTVAARRAKAVAQE
jgi:hypothetical protein